MTKQRVITALILAPVMIVGIFFLPLKPFAFFIAAICSIGAWEWANIAGYKKNWSRILYAFFVFVCLYISARFLRINPEWKIWFLAAGTLWWTVAFALVKRYPGGTDIWNARVIRAFLGLCVLIPMWVGFMHLKEEPHSSLLIIYVMLVVWGADTGAYFAGRKWGNSKLAPHVSPGKSWAGFWGGFATTIFLAAVTCVGLDLWLQPLTMEDVVKIFVITAATTVISVLGDLVESMMKRHRGIKDSSSLLPGHGGVMDRIDSMAAAVPVFAFMMMLLNWGLAV
ncbi:MAG: phosphatidate cytidylyltransferase [Oceanospirillaceae bacterium]|uniref:phosphatidate cytidylyltransferase n=1 Tax=Thalassolituus sp. TaxID=2030822 RepID=UPI000C52E861|nr:phosphatidate cytidylyltransferase [Oceanospirillaceae bacterium]